jgi:hypothetical protein
MTEPIEKSPRRLWPQRVLAWTTFTENATRFRFEER